MRAFVCVCGGGNASLSRGLSVFKRRRTVRGKGRWKGLQRAGFGRGIRSIKAVLNMLPWTADPLQARFINKGLTRCFLPVRHAELHLMPIIKFTTPLEERWAKCHSQRWSRRANYWGLGRRTAATEGHYSAKAQRKHTKVSNNTVFTLLFSTAHTASLSVVCFPSFYTQYLSFQFSISPALWHSTPERCRILDCDWSEKKGSTDLY